MPATYEPIATTTLGSAASSITFSSIPSTYTDLRIVLVQKATAIAGGRMTFNGDTATNYSDTKLRGDGTSATSARTTNVVFIASASSSGIPSAVFTMTTVDIFSYAGSTYKTALVSISDDENGSGYVQANVGLWRSTSAITSINFEAFGTTLTAGTTATLYGIKSA